MDVVAVSKKTLNQRLGFESTTTSENLTPLMGIGLVKVLRSRKIHDMAVDGVIGAAKQSADTFPTTSALVVALTRLASLLSPFSPGNKVLSQSHAARWCRQRANKKIKKIKIESGDMHGDMWNYRQPKSDEFDIPATVDMIQFNGNFSFYYYYY